jgi:hypothetical protein
LLVPDLASSKQTREVEMGMEKQQQQKSKQIDVGHAREDLASTKQTTVKEREQRERGKTCRATHKFG